MQDHIADVVLKFQFAVSPVSSALGRTVLPSLVDHSRAKPLQISLEEHPQTTHNTPSHPLLDSCMNPTFKSPGIGGFLLPRPG